MQHLNAFQVQLEQLIYVKPQDTATLHPFCSCETGVSSALIEGAAPLAAAVVQIGELAAAQRGATGKQRTAIVTDGGHALRQVRGGAARASLCAPRDTKDPCVSRVCVVPGRHE